MIISPDGQTIVSSIGWIDKSSLWCYQVSTDRVNNVSVSDAKYLTLHPGRESSLFGVFHHYDDSRIRYTVHSFQELATCLCSAELTPNGTFFNGKIELLEKVPKYFVAYYNPGDNADFCLIKIEGSSSNISVQRLAWYDDSYDKGYQGLVGVLELPSGLLLISIQRDSSPVLYDPVNSRVIHKIGLVGNHGNPKLRLLNYKNEIWADDYDSLVRLDSKSFSILSSKKLQTASVGTAQFIGDWSFNAEESLCFVARPFSGDIIAISTKTMKTKYVSHVGKEPIEVVAPTDDFVIARDWKTGNLLKGALKRKWFG